MPPISLYDSLTLFESFKSLSVDECSNCFVGYSGFDVAMR